MALLRSPRLKNALALSLLTAFFLAALGWFLVSWAASLAPPATQAAAPGPAVVRRPSERLSRPALPSHPTLADEGGQLYWAHCMACHGDQGQGLTPEWRSLINQADTYCQLPACDVDVLYPLDLILPSSVRPVIGRDTLMRFDDGGQLYRTILQTMPKQSPGTLTADQAWPLTVYLLRANGALLEAVELTPDNAMIALLHHPAQPRGDERPGAVLLAASLALAGGLLATGAKEWQPDRRPGFFHHLHPPTILAAQARWRYTLGAGGLAVFLVLVLAVTGALEMFFYIPTPEQAAPSIQALTYLVPYGQLVRYLHYWAAQALVVVAGLHLLRVIFTGATIRRFNYLLGMALFILALCMDFTGYMLRWDEGVRWPLVAGTNLLRTVPVWGNGLYLAVVGGEQPGAATLIRFYTWHIFGLTLGLGALMAWHIFKVRRDGGMVAPPVEQRPTAERVTRFELVRREIVAVLLASAALLLVATFAAAPLSMQPIKAAALPTADNRAPWFFLWVQQLLRWGNPFWLGVVVPLAALLLMGLLPYLFPAPHPQELGRWFPRGGRPAQIAAVILVLGVLSLTILSLLAPSR
jgi:quinol-cytochrome oxidoreductase complex cytochrome b subunit